VLVEALSDRAAECEQRRTSSKVVKAALSSPGSAPTATFARHSEIEWNSGLAERDQAGETVEVTTLDAVLEGHTGPIDFVVLDLEGHELPALEGFDLDRWQPRVLLVENNGADGVRSLLERRGYAFVAPFAQNDLFIRRAELELTKRLDRYWGDLGVLR
jgi:FkbM family methyltransferase